LVMASVSGGTYSSGNWSMVMSTDIGASGRRGPPPEPRLIGSVPCAVSTGGPPGRDASAVAVKRLSAYRKVPWRSGNALSRNAPFAIPAAPMIRGAPVVPVMSAVNEIRPRIRRSDCSRSTRFAISKFAISTSRFADPSLGSNPLT
jgi:hypothetical protein